MTSITNSCLAAGITSRAIYFIAAGFVATIPALKWLGGISINDAATALKSGALIIDVRSAREFEAEHIPNAINLPLGTVPRSLPQHVKDKNCTLLVDCHGGGRSGIARIQMKRMGYVNAFNLGSLVRARQTYQQASQT